MSVSFKQYNAEQHNANVVNALNRRHACSGGDRDAQTLTEPWRLEVKHVKVYGKT